jgi:hypothetical protein
VSKGALGPLGHLLDSDNVEIQRASAAALANLALAEENQVCILLHRRVYCIEECIASKSILHRRVYCIEESIASKSLLHRRVYCIEEYIPTYFDSHNGEQRTITSNIALLNMTMNGPLLFS